MILQKPAIEFFCAVQTSFHTCFFHEHFHMEHKYSANLQTFLAFWNKDDFLGFCAANKLVNLLIVAYYIVYNRLPEATARLHGQTLLWVYWIPVGDALPRQTWH